MADRIQVRLPNGLCTGEVWQRSATVRALTGEDEALLLEAGGAMLPAERNTFIISRCVDGLDARQLTVGDREAVLLWIRHLTFGPAIDAVLECSRPECGEKMDLRLVTSDLLVEPGDDRPEWEESEVDGVRVRFRRVTGADQEAGAREPADGVNIILRRCVAGELPQHVRRWMPSILAAADPQAEINLSVTCPACGRAVSLLLDAGTFLAREVAARSKALFRQVHLLAFHYHWAERDILALTPTRRHCYLDLLSEALTGAAHA
jgi:hypothetical protein